MIVSLAFIVFALAVYNDAADKDRDVAITLLTATFGLGLFALADLAGRL